MVAKEVIWTQKAVSQLESQIKYIKKDSVQHAENVKEEVFSMANQLSTFSERRPIDKYKTNNQGNYRVFEVFRLRISYRISAKKVYIVRVRNTNQSPMDY